MHETLTHTTTPGQNGSKTNSNEVVLPFPDLDGYSAEGILPLCREAAGVFYSPSRLSNPDLELHHHMQVCVISRTPLFGKRKGCRWYLHHILSPSNRAVSLLAELPIFKITWDIYFVFSVLHLKQSWSPPPPAGNIFYYI